MHWKEQELPFGLNTALLEFQLPLGGLGGVHLSQPFLSLSRSEQNTDVSSPAGLYEYRQHRHPHRESGNWIRMKAKAEAEPTCDGGPACL